MGDVVPLHVPTTLDVPVKKVLKAARKANLQNVMVVGTGADGCLYFASSTGEGPTMLWLLELAKAQLMAPTE